MEVDVSARPGLAYQRNPERPGPAKLVSGTARPASIIRFPKAKIIWKYRNYVYTHYIFPRLPNMKGKLPIQRRARHDAYPESPQFGTLDGVVGIEEAGGRVDDQDARGQVDVGDDRFHKGDEDLAASGGT